MKLTELTKTVPTVTFDQLAQGEYFKYKGALWLCVGADPWRHVDACAVLIDGGYFARKPGYVEGFGPKCECIRVTVEELIFSV